MRAQSKQISGHRLRAGDLSLGQMALEQQIGEMQIRAEAHAGAAVAGKGRQGGIAVPEAILAGNQLQ